MNLQRRVLAYLALAAIASCALSFGVAVILVRHRISAQRLSSLESQAAVLALVGGAPGALAAGEHVYRVGNGRPRPVGPRARAAVLARIPSSGDAQGTIQLTRRSLLYCWTLPRHPSWANPARRCHEPRMRPFWVRCSSPW